VLEAETTECKQSYQESESGACFSLFTCVLAGFLVGATFLLGWNLAVLNDRKLYEVTNLLLEDCLSDAEHLKTLLRRLKS